MDYEAYENRLQYPNKDEYTTRYWYKHGTCVARKVGNADPEILTKSYTRDALSDCTLEKAFDREAYRAAVAAYGAETARLTELFRADFYKELGIEDNPKRQSLFSKAWEQGHSSGYSEIMNCGWDLVGLIKD